MPLQANITKYRSRKTARTIRTECPTHIRSKSFFAHRRRIVIVCKARRVVRARRAPAAATVYANLSNDDPVDCEDELVSQRYGKRGVE
jgi:hypothetical protein